MLTVKNLSFSYSKHEFELNLNHLEFEKGSVHGVIGPNGSGKTTLLNIIGGHVSKYTGQVYFDTIPLDTSSSNRLTSTVFQELGLFPHMTVQENIEIAIEPNRGFRIKDQTREKSLEIIERFDLQDLSSRKPNQISVGQQQRVAIARAISQEPKILLLDEPSSALDFQNVHLLSEFIKRSIKKSVPIILLVSHDLNFVLKTVDRVKYLEEGKILFDGCKKEFEKSKWNLK
jgi:ABC-type multidrug transport system ATPase subunit